MYILSLPPTAGILSPPPSFRHPTPRRVCSGVGVYKIWPLIHCLFSFFFFLCVCVCLFALCFHGSEGLDREENPCFLGGGGGSLVFYDMPKKARIGGSGLCSPKGPSGELNIKQPALKKRGVPSRAEGETILEMVWKPQML